MFEGYACGEISDVNNSGKIFFYLIKCYSNLRI